jgi:phosphate transport system permease protein
MATQSIRPPLRASSVNIFSRRIKSGIVSGLALLATIIVIAPLIAILFYLLKQGVTSLNWDFFTKIPVPAGESGGGMENAIVGSAVILALASLIGIPLGIGAGIYLAEYAGSTRMGNLVRFTADVLNGVPSIVMGIAIYALIVLPQKHFSAFAGGVVLGVMMVPTVTRTTEEMLRMVPHGAPSSPSRCAPHLRASSPAACWRSPGWRGRPRPSSSPPSATHFRAPV